MSRLITFGCSYTFGVGLTGDGMFSSRFAWPVLTAKELNLELINKGEPSASNTEILYEILNFDYEATDTIVIMWTHAYRDLIFSKWGARFKLLRTRFNASKKDRSWQKQMNETDYNTKSWMCIHHADLFLKSKNLKYLHYPFSIHELSKSTIKKIEISNLCRDGMFLLDKGTDNLHPGIRSHKATSDNIVKVLNEK